MSAAGRGLAGLVAQHEPQLYCPQGPVSGINGTYTIAFHGCSCGWNSDGEASKAEKWSEHVVRALEAAAPPSTVPTWDDAYAAGVKLRDAMRETVERLATPSPQAPTEPKVLTAEDIERIGSKGHRCGFDRAPSYMTFDCDCKCGISYDENWKGIISRAGRGHPKCKCVPAATQEEPAGSGASEPSTTTDWRWMRLRGHLRQWLTPHQFEIAMDCLDKAERKEATDEQPRP